MKAKYLVPLSFILGILFFSDIGGDFTAKTASLMQDLLKYIQNDVSREVGSAILAAAVAFCTITMLPTTPLNLGAGATFGFVVGTLSVLVGCVVGACLAFLIARFFLRNWATRQLQQSPMLMALDAAVQQRGLFIIILSRLSPAFPFPLLSFIFGVTGVSFVPYTLGTMFGLLPGVALYTYAGLSMAEMAKSGDFTGDYTIWLNLGASVVSVIVISKVAKNILDEAAKSAKEKSGGGEGGKKK